MTEFDETALMEMFVSKVYDTVYSWLPVKKKETFSVFFPRSMEELLRKSVSFHMKNDDWRIALDYKALLNFAFTASSKLKCGYDNLIKEILQVIYGCDDLTGDCVKLLRVILRHSCDGKAEFPQVWDDSKYGMLRVRNFTFSLSTLEDDGIITVSNTSVYIEIENDVSCRFLMEEGN